MHALILAAGRGKRLGSLTDFKPKPLVPVADTPMLTRLIEQFIDRGVERLTIVVGHHAGMIQDAVEKVVGTVPVTFVTNPRYVTTNNAYSLWLARDLLPEVDVLSEADLVMDDEVVAALLNEAPPASWTVRPFIEGMDGAFLTMSEEAKLSSLKIVRPPMEWEPGGFKSMGLLRLSREFGTRLAGWLDEEVVEHGRTDRYYDLVVSDHLEELAPSLFVAADGFWSEIDTLDDLGLAEAALRGKR